MKFLSKNVLRKVCLKNGGAQLNVNATVWALTQSLFRNHEGVEMRWAYPERNLRFK
jgi:hypothetical protein